MKMKPGIYLASAKWLNFQFGIRNRHTRARRILVTKADPYMWSFFNETLEYYIIVTDSNKHKITAVKNKLKRKEVSRVSKNNFGAMQGAGKGKGTSGGGGRNKNTGPGTKGGPGYGKGAGQGKGTGRKK